MKAFVFLLTGAALLLVPLVADQAAAQTPSATEKLNAYIGCINRLSERSYSARSPYLNGRGWSQPAAAVFRQA
jgi:hypothetical protein